MKSQLVRLSMCSGEMTSTYSILEDDKTTRFQKFLIEWHKDYEDKLLSFARTLRSISNSTGATDNFFKLNEGLSNEDLVCALYDEPEKEMRLYCIKFSEKILVIGGGGPKPKHIKRWQDDLKLTKEVTFMMDMSEIIRKKLMLGSLSYSENEMFFVGNKTLM